MRRVLDLDPPAARTQGLAHAEAAMPRRLRLDAELVRRGLARSREHASELIAAKRVKVAGSVATKPATGVTTDVALVVTEDPERPDFVSRGGHKLAGALAAFAPRGLEVSARRCLDAGASTGGFTDVLLRHEAAEVVAVDVGYGQLAWSLQQDPRVVVHDRTNVRELSVEQIGGPVDVVVGDLSFISLELVLDALIGVTRDDGDLVLMVKPQFEVGKDRVGKGGVVRDLALRAEAVGSVAEAAARRGWGARAVTTSPLPGPSGNVEFFLWMRRGQAEIGHDDIEREVRRPAVPSVADERLDA
ncbi:hemolysin [Nocardioides pakistanensis]